MWIKFASRKQFRQCNNTQSEKEWFLCVAEVGIIVANLFPTYWWYWKTLLLKMGCNQSRGNGYEPIGWSDGHLWDYCPGARSLSRITATIFKDRVPVHLEVPYLQMIYRYLTIWLAGYRDSSPSNDHCLVLEIIHNISFRKRHFYGPLTRYVKLLVAHATGAGNVFPATDFKGNR